MLAGRLFSAKEYHKVQYIHTRKIIVKEVSIGKKEHLSAFISCWLVFLSSRLQERFMLIRMIVRHLKDWPLLIALSHKVVRKVELVDPTAKAVSSTVKDFYRAVKMR